MPAWVTVDKSGEKRFQEQQRKQRRREEKEEERMQLQAAVGADIGALVGSKGAKTSSTPVVVQQRTSAAATESTAANLKTQRQLNAEKKEEDAKRARRKAAAERAKELRDPALWPLTSKVVVNKASELHSETLHSLDGVVGEECSYVRALHATNTLELALRNSVPCDDGDVNDVALQPLAALEDDAEAMQVIDRFAEAFFVLGSDSDPHTVFNLWTTQFGSRGAKVDPKGTGVGSRLAAQLVVKHNLSLALAAAGMIADAFTAVEGNGRFHTAASAQNFMLLARTMVWAVQQAIQQHGSGDDAPCTLVEVRNGFICLLRALSNDGCFHCIDAAALLLDHMAETLELMVDMELAPRRAKAMFVPLMVQDAAFLMRFAQHRHIDPDIARLLLIELGLDHHPDVAKAIFCPTVALLNETMDSSPTEVVDAFTDALTLVILERGGDVFPSWAESFTKTAAASARVLAAAVAKGAAIDQTFLQKVQKRAAKLQGDAATLVADAVQVTSRSGNVENVVEASKRSRRSAEGQQQAADTQPRIRATPAAAGTANQRTTSGNWCNAAAVTMLKVGAVVALVGALVASGKW